MKKIKLQLERTTITQLSPSVASGAAQATNSSQGGACSCEQHCEQVGSKDCDSNCEWCSYSVTHD